MADLSAQIAEARKQGHSDDDIMSYLGTSHPELAPKIKEATTSGYGTAEILSHLSGPAHQTDKPGTLERVWNAFKEWAPPAPAGDWPAMGPQFRQQLTDLYHGVAGIVPQMNASLQKTGDAMLRGDPMGAVREAPGIVPVVGPMTQQIGRDVESGNYPEAGGHLLNLGATVFGPKILRDGPGAVADAAETARVGVPGAASGAWKGAAAPTALKVKVKGIPIEVGPQVPAIVAGGVTGATTGAGVGALAGMPQVGAGVGAAVGAVVPVVRGAVKGWKAAIQEAAKAKIPTPPPRVPIWQRPAPEAPPIVAEPPVPQEAPIEVPQGQPIPTPTPRWEDAAALERLHAEQTARAGVPPVAPEPVQPPAAPPAAAVHPEPAAATVTPAPRTLAQNEAAMMQKGAPPLDPQQSQFHANGEAKSPEFRAQEKIRGNTTAKATRWADALEGEDIPPQDLRHIEGGRVSDAQLAAGAPPRWENVKDHLIEKGLLQPGETVPKSSMPEIIAELQKRAKVKPASPAEAPPANSGVTAKSPRNMTRAELAKQAGLPENATTQEIMEAMAKAMEEDQPKAAAAAKGK